MEIFFSIIAVLSLIFCIGIIIDRTIFDRKMRNIQVGMTGKEIEAASGYKLLVLKVDKNTYYARIQSTFTVFKYRLVFFNGKLISKQKE